jgi:glyceraldehyde-3-phosphate dehydrogenase/erythrose-4-phosphate dehydrogenase
MVITKLVLELLLQSTSSLEGKLTSIAIRVPVPNGSLVVLNLQVKQNFYFSHQCDYENMLLKEAGETDKIFY